MEKKQKNLLQELNEKYHKHAYISERLALEGSFSCDRKLFDELINDATKTFDEHNDYHKLTKHKPVYRNSDRKVSINLKETINTVTDSIYISEAYVFVDEDRNEIKHTEYIEKEEMEIDYGIKDNQKLVRLLLDRDDLRDCSVIRIKKHRHLMVASADRFEIATMYRIMGLMQLIGRCRLVDCMYVTDFDIYSQKQYDDRQKDHSKKFMTRYKNNYKDDDKIKYLLDIPYYDYRASHKNKKI